MQEAFHKLLKNTQLIKFHDLLITISVIILLVAIVMLYEAKTATIQNKLFTQRVQSSTSQLTLSQESTEMITTFSNTHTKAAIVGIVAIELETNSRRLLFKQFNDKALLIIADAHTKEGEDKFPLFDLDPVNNAEISTLLGGEFTCSTASGVPFLVKYGLQDSIKLTCRAPIPPYYGKLTGYLVMYFTKELSIYEIDTLRSEALKLAIDIYYQDVANPARGERPIISR
jgi:hypothetical protein